ncbi:MAG: hypothetical protein GKR90_03730 [Pseudomonadales bacterium]|nr:hypothetical protein [Pseudomonadales bacterium]
MSQTSFTEAAGNYQARLREHADSHEAKGVVDTDLFKDLRSAGLLNLVTPKLYGGQEVSFSTLSEVISTLAGGCMSTAWVSAVGNVHNWMATGFSASAQDEYFADPDVFSSASFAPTGRATMQSDGLIANGTWSFLSGVDHAQWVFLCGLVTESVDGRPTGPWFMMIPKDEVVVDDDSWHVVGMAGTGSKDVTLKNVFVPIHRAAHLPSLMINEGPGHGIHHGDLFRSPFHAALVAILASPIYGTGLGALEQFRAYTEQRVNKMTGAKQSEQAASQLIVAECAAAIDAAGLVLERNFKVIDTARPITAAEAVRIPRDTAYCVRLVTNATNTMMSNAGGNSAKLSNPLQRAWRDIQTAANHAALSWPNSAQAWGQFALKPQA